MGKIVEAWMVLAQARQRGRLAGNSGFEKFFGLFLVLFDTGVVRQDLVGHTKLLSRCAWNVRTDQAERRFVNMSTAKVGTALSADWMRPSRWNDSNRSQEFASSGSPNAPVMGSLRQTTTDWAEQRSANPILRM
jgi:hypothetical protein